MSMRRKERILMSSTQILHKRQKGNPDMMWKQSEVKIGYFEGLETILEVDLTKADFKMIIRKIKEATFEEFQVLAPYLFYYPADVKNNQVCALDGTVKSYRIVQRSLLQDEEG